VSFESGKQERVLVPETAISQPGQAERGAGEQEKGREVQQNSKGMFVVTGGEDSPATVTARR